jgi:hypothetical protein
MFGAAVVVQKIPTRMLGAVRRFVGYLLLENGDFLFLESGDKIILEG